MLSAGEKRILQPNSFGFTVLDYAFFSTNTYVCSMGIGMCWFRKDLRLADNPAWANACAEGHVIPVFVIEPSMVNASSFRKRELFYSHLLALKTQIAELGGNLLIINGPAEKILPRLVRDCGVDSLHFNDDSSPFSRVRDEHVIRLANVRTVRYWGNLVHAPGSILTNAGSVHKVFTPFYKIWAAAKVLSSYEPEEIIFAEIPHHTNVAIEVKSPPAINPGSSGANRRLDDFLKKIADYRILRDFPSVEATSHLSSDLHFGTIGPRAILEVLDNTSDSGKAFIRQLAWRDWYAHLLFASPQIVDSSANPIYNRVAWKDDKDDYMAWVGGKTGYPIVDAGMRELNETGFMHNRVRMIAGSFLVKHLLIDWRKGERHFRRLLLDGDLSQNVGNWQWVAGTGFDAAPYFRIFNPVRQSLKFDKNGAYIRKWVPELAGLDNKAIHAPWTVDQVVLAKNGVQLGENYPFPLIDHALARERCLATYKAARATAR